MAIKSKQLEFLYKQPKGWRFLSPELHKQAAITAAARQMSLNSFDESSIVQTVRAGN